MIYKKSDETKTYTDDCIETYLKRNEHIDIFQVSVLSTLQIQH